MREAVQIKRGSHNLEVIDESESAATVPLTIPSLKRKGDELQQEASEFSPSFQERLKLVLQGGLVQAQSGALAIEHREHTHAAEQSRNARRKAHNRRQL